MDHNAGVTSAHPNVIGNVRQLSLVWLALGANVASAWGRPCDTLNRVHAELQALGHDVVARSSLYSTRAVGKLRQPRFVNGVIAIRAAAAPAALLRQVKSLERLAGRRVGIHWGPRPLDIDLLDFGGRQIGRARETRIGRPLQLPHPAIMKRGFVLGPLAEVAPNWRHPRLGWRARDMLRREPHLRRGLRRIASSGRVKN